MLDKETRYLDSFVRNNPIVKDLNMLNHEFLYTAYADDTTFFLKDLRNRIL